MKLVIDIPDEGLTCGDITAAKGAIVEASTGYVDWEALYTGAGEAVSAPGRILLAVAHQLGNEQREEKT